MANEYRSGLASAVHDNMDVDTYYHLVNQAVCRHPSGLIIDAFSGAGRDILTLRKILNNNGRFVAVDADRKRIEDMLAKNGPDNIVFTEVVSAFQVAEVFVQNKIAVIQGEFPAKPFGQTDIQFSGQADFILCNVGIMFVTPEKLESTLSILTGLMALKAEMFLRFSLDRIDQRENLNYHIHDPSHVEDLLKKSGLSVTRNPDLPDPNARPFLWVDLHCQKLS
jgi:hypothetical protein